ncbi:MAG: hypothetical protein FWH21_00870 [Kiritimatiellaeota bacterium]|nr:hypothetical protein [Kiritimatiellota bacterium]
MENEKTVEECGTRELLLKLLGEVRALALNFRPKYALMTVGECAEEFRMPMRSFKREYIDSGVLPVYKTNLNGRKVRRSDFEKLLQTMATGYNSKRSGSGAHLKSGAARAAG